MRKITKFFIVLLITLGSIFAILALLASPIARFIIERYDTEIIGRNIELETIKVNLFTGNIEVNNAHIQEQDLQSDFVTLKKLEVGINYLKLIRKEVLLKHIGLHGFQINVIQGDSTFNFSSIIEHFAPENEDDTPSQWKVGLYDIHLTDGAIAYENIPLNNRWNVHNLKLYIPGLYFSGKSTDVGLAFELPTGGKISTKMQYNMELSEYNITLQTDSIHLSNGDPFIKEYLNVGGLDGYLNSYTHIIGNLQNIENVYIDGDAEINDIKLYDEQGETFASLDHIYTKLDSINIRHNNICIDSIAANGLFMHYDILGENDNNFARILKTSADSLNEESTTEKDENELVFSQEHENKKEREDLKLSIKHLELTDLNFIFNDSTMSPSFSYKISEGRILSKNFALNKSNLISASANLPQGGILSVRWNGTPDFEKDDQRINILLKNIVLNEFSPYSYAYFAQPISKGILSINSETTIRNAQLKSNNKIDIYDCKMGEKNTKLKAPYQNIPLKAALYLLKDLKNNIQLSLPVQGNISAPEFSYRKIIFKAFTNTLVKLIATPFAALGKNNKGENYDYISINPIQYDFSSEQYDKLATVASIFEKLHNMKLIMTQQFNYDNAIKDQALYNLKRDYYIHLHPDKNAHTLSLIEMDDIKAIKKNDAALVKFAKTLTKNKSNDIAQSAITYYTIDSLESEIVKQMEIRNTFLRRYMINHRNIDDNLIIIQNLSLESLREYEGESRYALSLEAIEEENENNEEDIQ